MKVLPSAACLCVVERFTTSCPVSLSLQDMCMRAYVRLCDHSLDNFKYLMISILCVAMYVNKSWKSLAHHFSPTLSSDIGPTTRYHFLVSSLTFARILIYYSAPTLAFRSFSSFGVYRFCFIMSACLYPIT